MSNPKLQVEIVGDSRKLTKTLKETETSTKLWAAKLQGITAGSAVGSRGSLATSAALLRGGGFAIGAGVALAGLKSVTDAAKNAQVILGQTSVAVTDAGLSWGQYGKQVQDASLRISKSSAFDDEQVLQSFSVFVRGQKDVGKALELSQLAADVARGRYTDLASATQLVNKAALGQIGALRRAGIAIDKNATATQALAALQAAYGGAAVRYSKSAAGAQDRLRVSVENLRESLGTKLLPTLTKVTNNLTDATNAAGGLGKALADLNNSTGGSGGSFLHGLTGAPWGEMSAFVKVLGSGHLVAFGQAPSQTLETLNNIKAMKQALAETTVQAQAFSDAFGLGALTTSAGLRNRPEEGTTGLSIAAAAAATKPKGKGVTADQRNRWFDTDITRRLDRVQDIGTINGQISALAKIAALIQKRIAVTKDITRKLSLEDQLVAVNRQSKSIKDQQAADFKDRLATSKANQLAALTARQFRELGLDAQGNAVTPGVANLRKRLGSFETAVKGTFLDTSKTETQLARFRKVLSEALVPKDVRAKFSQMLDDLNQQLRDHQKKGPVAKTTQLSDSILDGLGLSRDETRRLRARLSQFDSRGRGLAAAPGTVGAFGMALGHVAGSTTVVVDLDGRTIAKSTVKHTQKMGRRNPQQTRGRNL